MMNKKAIVALFVLFASLFATQLQAQDCYLKKDEKDAFTGEVTRMYTHVFAAQGGAIWYVQLDQKGSTYSITLTPQVLGRTMLVATANTHVMLKLEDGTILELLTDEDIQPVFVGSYTKWPLKITLKGDQLKKLSASPMTDIKLKIDTREIVASEIKSKHGEKMMRGAACMLQKG